MGFFDPLPEPPEPTPLPPREPWMGAPPNELGAAVGVSLLLARTDDVAVGIDGVTAFSTGVRLTLVVKRAKRPEHGPGDSFGWGLHRGYRHGADELRFGVQLADDAKATSLDAHRHDREQPPRAVLWPGGGHADEFEQRTELWLWPLPPPGPVAFVVEWPAAGIPETRAEVDAALFREAAERAVRLWPEPPPADPPLGDHFTNMQFVRARDDEPPA